MIRIAAVEAGAYLRDYDAALRFMDDACLAAVVHREPAARVGGEEFEVDIVAESFEHLLAAHADQFDAVIVHADADRRAAMARQALDAGKHLLVEFPVSTSVRDIDPLLTRCQSVNVKVMAAQPLRLAPFLLVTRDAIESGKLGDLGLLRIHHWTHERPPEDSSTLDLCIRETDLACWLFEAVPQTVYSTRFDTGGQESPAGVQLHLGFSGGGMAMVGCAHMAATSDEPYFTLSVIGARGAVYADDHRNMNLLFRKDLTALNVGQGRGHIANLLEEFVRCVRDDVAATCSIGDARRALLVAEAALESQRTRAVGNWVGDRYEFA